MGIRNYIEEQEVLDFDIQNLTEGKSGAEIARILGISRQSVSQTLKRALKKVFKEIKKEDSSKDSFEAAVEMSIIFNVPNQDLSSFIRLFPSKIRREIEEDGRKRMAEEFRK